MSSLPVLKDLLEPTISLRAAYEADMAFAINDARKGCGNILGGKGPWLGPKNEAILQEARNHLNCLPSVLVDLIDSYGDFVDFERFRSVMPLAVLPDSIQPSIQSILMMAIGTNNFELFDGLNSFYKMPWRYMQGDHFTEFGQFMDISGRRMNSFKGTMKNIIRYLGRGNRWTISLRFGSIAYSGLRYALMGSGPVDEVKKVLELSNYYRSYSREELIAIAMGSQEGPFFGRSDANPEIIEFLSSMRLS
jgi:hypothetical protein